MKEINELMSDLIRFISLTKGVVAVVDAWCFDAIVAMGAWQSTRGYAHRGQGGIYGCHQIMHREVLLLAGHDITGLEVDHANGDRADNRLSNLRPATRQQNSVNSRSKSQTSRYKGLYQHKDTGRWQARFKLNGQERSLGCYATEEEAARAYDAKVFELFGHWSKLNFPLDLPYRYEGPPIVERPSAIRYGVRSA